MTEAWTTRRLLAWITQDFKAQQLGTPRLDAELIISHVLGIDRVRLYMDLERPLASTELAAVRALVVRRRQREPVAYLIGHREFYRRAFKVTPAVLIPRPDTETLIERACALLPENEPRRVLDLCTGSGAIAVTLAAERPLLSVVATDLSEPALAIARENARTHGVEARVELRQGDLFAALSDDDVGFDLVVANPPYIPEGELSQLAAELQHEPRLALTSGAEGLDVIVRLCAEVDRHLLARAAVLFEVGAGQAGQVAQLLAANTRITGVITHRDLGGIERVVEAALTARSV